MNTLDELIKSYGEHDSTSKMLKKICDEEKAQIKDLMALENLDVKSAHGWKVTRSISERESLDEDKMIAILLEQFDGECPYVKTKPYIDMDALESALYAGELSMDVLARLEECKKVTTVVTLKCTKAKKVEEN